jgi:hypothetical protein
MLVYESVQTSTYRYILVHQSTYFVLLFYFLLHPAGPPESCRFAAAKRHSSSYTLVYSSSVLTACPPTPLAIGAALASPARPLLPAPPAPLPRRWAPVPQRLLLGIAISSSSLTIHLRGHQ